jgi:hypothetical protein
MRILIAATEIGGLIHLFADGFRRLGHHVTTAVVQKNQWFSTTYDFDFSEKPLDGERLLEAGFLFGDHDLVIYVWVRQGLLPDFLDLPYLSKKGKQIVSVCVGSDVRHYGSYAEWNLPLSDYIKQLSFTPELLEVSLRTLRAVELYSTIVLSQPNQSFLGVRPFHHFYLPINLAELNHHVPDNQVPIVLHAPTRPQLKGTEFYLNALEQLKNEGVPFELRLLENVNHQDLLRQMTQADIVLDELYFPLYGKTTIEALACGCVVTNGDDPELEPIPRERPIWKVMPSTIVDQLRQLLTNRDERLRLAHRGRRFVEAHHDHVWVARYILSLLQMPEQPYYLHWPTYYYTRFQKKHEIIPADVQALTYAIVQRHGLPPQANLMRLVQDGLLPAELLRLPSPLPDWRP